MKIKRNLFKMLAVALLLLSQFASAQIVLTVQGNVSDLNGNPIANHIVYMTDDTTSMINTAIATTDVNGDYTGILTTLTSQGVLIVATEDCNANLVMNTHAFSPNIISVTSNFIICAAVNPVSCIDSSLIDTTVMCQQIYNPVCGCDSVTYANPCVAENYGGVTSYTTGPCGSSSACQAAFSAINIGFNPNAVPVVMQFYDASTPFGNIMQWTWDFGDGTTGSGQSPVHNYQVPGTYFVCLDILSIDAIGDTCISTYCDSVWADTIGINPPSCYADFMSSQVAISDSTYFTNLSSAPATATYYWDFGDGSTSSAEHPVHLYATSGWYNICLIVMDSVTNCYNTYCSYINVIVAGGSGCQAYFYGTPGTGGAITYDFFDYSSGNITNWYWDFGDGTSSTLQNPTHMYTSANIYLVCLTVEELDSNGTVLCTDTYCDSIFWNQPFFCQADFYGQDLGSNMAGFVNNTYPQTGNTMGLYNYVDIDFGDGIIDYNIGATVNHTYASAGTYYACVTVTSMDSSLTVICTDTYCDSVTVTSGTMPCQANFTSYRDSNIIFNPNGTSVIIGNMYYFVDLSTPMGLVESWQWDMGDNGVGTYLQGTSDTSQMPVYEYDTTGSYSVCLTITTFGGQCSSTSCDTLAGSPTAIDQSLAIKVLNIYPVPATNKLTIDLSAMKSTVLTLNIINTMGQVVRTDQANLAGGENSYSMELSQIANGVYSVELITAEEKQYQRIIISR